MLACEERDDRIYNLQLTSAHLDRVGIQLYSRG